MLGWYIFVRNRTCNRAIIIRKTGKNAAANYDKQVTVENSWLKQTLLKKVHQQKIGDTCRV
jgi:hypothetical protein